MRCKEYKCNYVNFFLIKFMEKAAEYIKINDESYNL